jgi:DNA-directed RNA polymerase subunit RPC12/RpoP
MGSLIPSFSARSISILNDTFLFSGLDVLTFVAFLLTTTLLIVAASMLSDMTDTFSGTLFGGENAEKAGKSYREQSQAVVAEGEYFVSGYAAKDAAINTYRDVTKSFAPFIHPDEIRARRNKAEEEKNKKLADKYKNDLLAQGVDNKKAQEAAKAYQDALNSKIKARDEHAKQELERREARRAALESRDKMFRQSPSDPKEVKCKHCGHKFKKGQVKGANKCPHCGQKNAFK